jgi:hypothetical protein
VSPPERGSRLENKVAVSKEDAPLEVQEAAHDTHARAQARAAPLGLSAQLEPRWQGAGAKSNGDGTRFVFDDPRSDTRVELVAGRGGFTAKVRLSDWETYKLALTVERGWLVGRLDRANGHTVELAFKRAQASVDVTIDAKTQTLELADSTSEQREAYLQQAQGLAKAGLAEEVAALQTDASLSDAQKRAVALLPRVSEGPGMATFHFLEQVTKATDLTAAEAEAAPFYYAIETGAGGVGESCRSLAQNAETLLERHRGTAAGNVLAHALAAYRERGENDDLGMHLLIAGLDGAAHAVSSPEKDPLKNEVRSIMRGWSMSNWVRAQSASQDKSIVPLMGMRNLRFIHDALPEGHPLKTFLDQELISKQDEDRKNLTVPVRMTRNALALGAVQTWLDTGALPSADTLDFTGMPTITARQAFVPLCLREASPPDPDPEKMGWTQVGQADGLGNCYYAAGEAAIAEKRSDLAAPTIRRFTTIDGDGKSERRYRVTMHLPDNTGRRRAHEQWIDGRLYCDVRSGRFVMAGDRSGSTDPESPGLWLALKEKAFAFRPGVADYGTIEGGNPIEVFDTNFGDDAGKYWSTRGQSEADFIKELKRLFEASAPVVACTDGSSEEYKDSALLSGHAYLLLGLETRKEGTFVRLVNLHQDPPPRPGIMRANPLEDVGYDNWEKAGITDEAAKVTAGEFELPVAEVLKYVKQVAWCDVPPPPAGSTHTARAS